MVTLCHLGPFCQYRIWGTIRGTIYCTSNRTSNHTQNLLENCNFWGGFGFNLRYNSEVRFLPTTTHNNQNEPPPPYPPAALPSLSMGGAVVPPNFGTTTPHGSTASARWRVCNRRGWFPCLGHQNVTRQKNRERDKVLALGGCHLDVKHNNQPKVGVRSEEIIIEETQSWWNVWGGRRIFVWGWQIERQETKTKKHTHRCLWTAADQQLLTQQPTKNRCLSQKGVWRGCALVRRHGGRHDTIILGALEVGRLIKTQINHWV